MADNDYRLSAVGDELFEPLDRLDVEVVGRFVEEEYVGRPEEEFSEFDAHSPSSGELACRAVEVGALEAESE